MRLLDPSQPLKVVKKLLHKNYNIGLEGTLDCYLCNTIESDSVILTVFIGTYEDVSLKVVVETGQPVASILEALKTMYINISMQERNEHYYLH